MHTLSCCLTLSGGGLVHERDGSGGGWWQRQKQCVVVCFKRWNAGSSALLAPHECERTCAFLHMRTPHSCTRTSKSSHAYAQGESNCGRTARSPACTCPLPSTLHPHPIFTLARTVTGAVSSSKGWPRRRSASSTCFTTGSVRGFILGMVLGWGRGGRSQPW
jgi:hypothetical protein